MKAGRMQFRTHAGTLVEGAALQKAQGKVADDLAALARGIFQEDCYAAHVTRAEKETYLQDGLKQAERVRAGKEPIGFWLWQRIDTELTGECVAFLPK